MVMLPGETKKERSKYRVCEDLNRVLLKHFHVSFFGDCKKDSSWPRQSEDEYMHGVDMEVWIVWEKVRWLVYLDRLQCALRWGPRYILALIHWCKVNVMIAINGYAVLIVE